VRDEITTGQAKDILGVTRRQVSRLVADGSLTPTRRIGANGWYLLDREAVERYAATRAETVGTT
jgi:excisionase family DNA binding protein